MKNLLYILLLSPLFFISSCEKDEVQGEVHGCLDSQACNYNSQATIDNNSCVYPTDSYNCDEIDAMYAEGGIVFYVDETGEHGLVAALEDLEGKYEWGCYGAFIGNFGSADLGLQNTMDIVNYCATENGGITAAQAALDYEANGYSDWYLPTFAELDMMRDLFYASGQGSFMLTNYWSSTEHNDPNGYYAKFVDFDYNQNDYSSKKNTFRVRAVRSF